MGGRGSSGGKSSGSRASVVNTKFTATELKMMTRSQLETVARAVFIKQNPRLSAAEADYRARSMMSGNSDAQLRNYIKKRG